MLPGVINVLGRMPTPASSQYGNVDGPTSSTDNAIVRFDGTTGKLIQNSVLIVADTTGALSGFTSGNGITWHGGGTITGASGALTLTASGTNQNITLTPSGTGSVILSTTATGVCARHVGGTNPQLLLQTDTTTRGILQASNANVFLDAAGTLTFRTSSVSSPVVALTLDTSQFLLKSTGSNGQALNIKHLTELTTIAAAATTDTTIQMPANSIVLSVSVRVTVVIPTATNFTVGDSGSAARFSTAAVSSAANSTDPGTKAGAYYNASALSVRITPDATPADNSGRVRVTIAYLDVTVPTS